MVANIEPSLDTAVARASCTKLPFLFVKTHRSLLFLVVSCLPIQNDEHLMLLEVLMLDLNYQHHPIPCSVP